MLSQKSNGTRLPGEQRLLLRWQIQVMTRSGSATPWAMGSSILFRIQSGEVSMGVWAAMTRQGDANVAGESLRQNKSRFKSTHIHQPQETVICLLAAVPPSILGGRGQIDFWGGIDCLGKVPRTTLDFQQ